MSSAEVGICRDFPTWCSLSAQLFPGVQLACATLGDFHCAWSSWKMEDIVFSEFFVAAPVDMTRHVGGRTPEAPPVHHLFLQQAGLLRHRQFGRVADSSTQVLSLVDGCAPYSCSQSANFHSLVVSVPTAVLQSRYGDLRPACVIPRSAHFGSGSVLWNFLVNVWQRRHEISPHEAEPLAAALLDLLGVLFRPESASDAGSLARNRMQLLDHISAHLPDPELGVQPIAAALGISVRQVHKLMEGTGTTLSRYILEQRLEHCMKAMSNPLLSRLTITEIALQWGFNDMSHFSRIFRARVGDSPRSWRQHQRSLRQEEAPKP